MVLVLSASPRDKLLENRSVAKLFNPKLKQSTALPCTVQNHCLSCCWTSRGFSEAKLGQEDIILLVRLPEKIFQVVKQVSCVALQCSLFA